MVGRIVRPGLKNSTPAASAFSSTVETLELTLAEALKFLIRHRKLIVERFTVIADISFFELLKEAKGGSW